MLRRPTDQSGFSLLEVLISLVIISIGLLGVAGIQALSINNTGVSRTRSLAAIEASSLASAMHSNPGYWANNSNVTTAAVSVQGTAGGGYSATALSDAALTTAQSAVCTSSSTPCTGIQMAAYDLSWWGLDLANQLPGGVGQVQCSNTTGLPVSCLISISWTENNVALNKKTGTETGDLATGQQKTQTYTMVVQP